MPTPSQDVRHPEWCQPTICTSTPAYAAGEAHHGNPVVTEISGGLTPTIITANLFMPNAEWITEVYLTIRWDGLLTDSYTAVSGSATIPAHMAGELAQALGCLASRASADKKIEITEYVASLTKEAQ